MKAWGAGLCCGRARSANWASATAWAAGRNTKPLVKSGTPKVLVPWPTASPGEYSGLCQRRRSFRHLGLAGSRQFADTNRLSPRLTGGGPFHHVRAAPDDVVAKLPGVDSLTSGNLGSPPRWPSGWPTASAGSPPVAARLRPRRSPAACRPPVATQSWHTPAVETGGWPRHRPP